MEPGESFMDFVRRWRAKSVQMKEKPSEKDQIRMIVRNLQPALAKHMILAQASFDFKTFFETGLAVEEAVQLGILENTDSFSETKDVDPGSNSTVYGYTNPPCNPTNTDPAQTEPVSQIIAQASKPKQPRVFSQFPVPLSMVFERLVKSGTIKPLLPTPIPQKLPTYHNPNAFCSFHQMPGHATDDCHRLRHKIQNLIDDGTIPIPDLRFEGE
ncbi:hypothetical protein RHMOL_Rhmol07G0203300 [Rhododendron molle]|uniref:Uncharacterized protein n=1 Tax=Rhododendron molle TaxID=49168 RepID=A0ACC0N3F0_RHOML|nr:hypothetical protein RHMOL_Rhmol07G0203300 [Rhododendron molle]